MLRYVTLVGGSGQKAARPRAAGVRLPYGRLPAAVRGWAEDELGAPVTGARTQAGGMSPGCAARLRTADGGAAFLKAVGPELNPDTPGLFRHELTVLRALSPAPGRPRLLASYDDGSWTGLLLEDVEGRHPDLTDAATAAAVWDAVTAQARELTPAPAGLRISTLADNARKWAQRWRLVAEEPARYLPDWAAPQAGALLARVLALPGRLAGESLCHWDIRNDNLLIRPDGQVVIFDLGMARIGPAWADEFCLALEAGDEQPSAACLAAIEQRHGVPGDLLTDVIIALAGSLAWSALQPQRPGLPNMAGFCLLQARRLLRAAESRCP